MVRSEDEKRLIKAEYNRWYRANRSPPSFSKEKKHEYQARYRDKVRGTPEYKERLRVHNAKMRARVGQTPEYKARKLAWQQANPERMKMASLRHRLARRAAMLQAYGGECACCGETEETFLTLDHANGDGAADRRARGSRGNSHLFAELQRLGWPQDGYRLLCWNCQYGTYRGTCPHQAAA